jgi:hypothetical protein
MKLSDYVVDFMARQGVRHVFMVPGGGAMHLNDSLGRHPDAEVRLQPARAGERDRGGGLRPMHSGLGVAHGDERAREGRTRVTGSGRRMARVDAHACHDLGPGEARGPGGGARGRAPDRLPGDRHRERGEAHHQVCGDRDSSPPRSGSVLEEALWKATHGRKGPVVGRHPPRCPGGRDRSRGAGARFISPRRSRPIGRPGDRRRRRVKDARDP